MVPFIKNVLFRIEHSFLVAIELEADSFAIKNVGERHLLCALAKLSNPTHTLPHLVAFSAMQQERVELLVSNDAEEVAKLTRVSKEAFLSFVLIALILVVFSNSIGGFANNTHVFNSTKHTACHTPAP